MIDTVSGQSLCVSRRISMPSRSSSRRSVSTTSNSCSRSWSSASLPLVTAVTSLPSSSRMALIVVATLCSSSTTRTLVFVIVWWPRDRQRDRERRALTGSASHLQRPAVRLHDAVRHPQAEAGALLHLRREERLEDARDRFFAHSRASVADVDAHDVGRIRLQLASAGVRRDDEPSARGHGLGGVEEQVEEDLLQLIGRCVDE